MSILKEALLAELPKVGNLYNDTPVTLTDQASRTDRRTQFTFCGEHDEPIKDQDLDLFYLSYTQPCDARHADTVRNIHMNQNES